MEKKAVMENMILKLEEHMKVIGLMVYQKEKEYKNHQMAKVLLEIFILVNIMVLVF